MGLYDTCSTLLSASDTLFWCSEHFVYLNTCYACYMFHGLTQTEYLVGSSDLGFHDVVFCDCRATELGNNVKAYVLVLHLYISPSLHMHSHSSFLGFFWFVWSFLVVWLVFSFRKLFCSPWVFNIFLFSPDLR